MKTKPTQPQIGDVVVYEGEERTVLSVVSGLIGGPYVRLTGVRDGLTAWSLIDAAEEK